MPNNYVCKIAYAFHDTYYVVAHFHYVLRMGPSSCSIVGLILLFISYYLSATWFGHFATIQCSKKVSYITGLFFNSFSIFQTVNTLYNKFMDEISVQYLAGFKLTTIFVLNHYLLT